MDTFHCPNCGHHLFDSKKSEPPADSDDRPIERQHYDASADIIQFLEDCTVVDRAGRVPTSELLGIYKMWCARDGSTAVSDQLFGRILKVDGEVEQTRSNGKRYYLGLVPAGKLAAAYYGLGL